MLEGDLLEDPDEQPPDRLSLLLGVAQARQGLKKSVCRLHVHEIEGELAQKCCLHLFALTGAHEAGVDEHRRQLVTDGLVHKGGRHGRVDSPGKGDQGVAGSDLGADRLALCLDDRGVCPKRATTADIEQEMVEQLASPFGVHHLGVELHPVNSPRQVLEGGDGHLGGGRCHGEPGRSLDDRVGVAHPDHARGGPVLHEDGGLPGEKRGAAELSSTGAGDLSAEHLGEQLGPVADPENGQAHAEQSWVDRGRGWDINRARPAGEDDPSGLAGEHLGRRHRCWDDL